MRQSVNISKGDMEDYKLAMFTHAMEFFKECEFKKVDSKAFFHKLIERFVNKRLVNTWEFIIHKIHESSTMTLCNSKWVNSIRI
jgi:hypothetical protein